MTRPLMPKATAVWLLDNTTLSFEQIADFCQMHPLEIQAIADGEVAAHIMGLDPVANGQLTKEEIERCQSDENENLSLSSNLSETHDFKVKLKYRSLLLLPNPG